MKVDFSDFFQQESKAKSGKVKGQVIQAVESPDAQQAFQFEGLKLVFFMKHLKVATTPRLLLVLAQEKDDTLLISIAYFIPPDLPKRVGSVEPLIVLQGFSQRFGLSVRIGPQLGRFIWRQIIELDHGGETELVQIVNPMQHSFHQQVFIRIEQRGTLQVAHCAIAFCIDTDEYLAWLNDIDSTQDVAVLISPQLKGHITPRDLIKAAGTVMLRTNYSELGGEKTGVLARIGSSDYQLELGVGESTVYVTRNDQELQYVLEPVEEPHDSVTCFLTWEPTHLRITLLDADYDETIKKLSAKDESVAEVGRRTVELGTHATIPPFKLLEWARNRAISPVKIYDSHTDVYQTVAEALTGIGEEIVHHSFQNAFWNIAYDGQRIVDRVPKSEPDIQPTIHALLYNIAEAKNLLIAREYPIAGGLLDFLVTAPLRSGNLTSVAIEFKHAHSDDIEKGLLKQLPAYMRAKAADFGIYCVLYFKGRHYKRPENHDADSLYTELTKLRLENGLQNIRVEILDVSHKEPPSRL